MSEPATPSAQRKRFKAFAIQIDKGLPLTGKQLAWLKHTFLALSDPNRDVMRVLGLKYTAGHSAQKDLAAQKMDFLMQWIASAINEDTAPYKDPNDSPAPMTLEQAFAEAARLAKVLFANDPKSQSYDRDYIKKCWYDQSKVDRQSPYRDPSDPKSYYDFPVDG